jgi:hypothetical protein
LVYQDRLRANMGKALKEERCAFSYRVHWTDHGPKPNLDDSGGVVIHNGTAFSLSAGCDK